MTDKAFEGLPGFTLFIDTLLRRLHGPWPDLFARVSGSGRQHFPVAQSE